MKEGDIFIPGTTIVTGIRKFFPGKFENVFLYKSVDHCNKFCDICGRTNVNKHSMFRNFSELRRALKKLQSNKNGC